MAVKVKILRNIVKKNMKLRVWINIKTEVFERDKWWVKYRYHCNRFFHVKTSIVSRLLILKFYHVNENPSSNQKVCIILPK